MIPIDHGFELAKMAVSPARQGNGVGRRLMSACLDFARAADASEIMLVTNTVLEPAVTLYESVGFEALDAIEDDRYARGNLEMRLRLD